MQVDWQELRALKSRYEECKGDLSQECIRAISLAKRLGCVQRDGHEDVRIALAFVDGFIGGAEFIRLKK